MNDYWITFELRGIIRTMYAHITAENQHEALKMAVEREGRSVDDVTEWQWSIPEHTRNMKNYKSNRYIPPVKKANCEFGIWKPKQDFNPDHMDYDTIYLRDTYGNTYAYGGIYDDDL